MSEADFILIAAGIALFGAVLGLLGGPRAPPPPRLPEKIHRWEVYRLHADLLSARASEGLAVEPLTGGSSLVRDPRYAGERDLHLAPPGGGPRVILTWRGIFRRRLRVAIDRKTLLEWIPDPSGKSLPRIREPGPAPELSGLKVAGDAGRIEIELRRQGKLVASLAREIAARPGCLGLEIRAGEAPLPILAAAAGLAVILAPRLREIEENERRSSRPAPAAPPRTVKTS